MMDGRLGALVCGVAISVVVAGCGSKPRKPQTPPPSTQPARKPLPAPRPQLPPLNLSGSTAERIVAVALREHATWYQPFIDGNGRLASYRLSEAEQSGLADGTEAWQRVLGYWRNSGTLYEMAQSNITGAYSCQFPSGFAQGKAECRTFIVDNPWSAAFVSYVMVQARVPGFRASPRHYDYIRQAFHADMGGPYYYADPATQRADPGDLLCFVRGSGSVAGYEGLTARLNGPGGSLNTHCDIVVGRDRELRLVGGNVFNGVTMRKLKLDAQGRAVLPRPISAGYYSESGDIGASCSPSNEAACDFNRQNWAVLLKLKPMTTYPTQATGMPAPRPVTPSAYPSQPSPRPVTSPVYPSQPPAPRPVAPPVYPSQPSAPAPTAPATQPVTPTPVVPQPQTPPPLPPANPPPVSPQPALVSPPATQPQSPPPVAPP